MNWLDPLGPVKAKIMLGLGGAAALAIAALFAWAVRLDHLRGDWRDKFEARDREAGVVLIATRNASDNQKLEWPGVAGQVLKLGDSIGALKRSITTQNDRLDDMARQALALQADAAELRRIANLAEAQRRGAMEQLASASISPGTRADCEQLLHEAEAALDLVYGAGL